MFSLYNGYLMGLPTNDNHLVFRWYNPDCKILFSCTRRGDAMSCHYASDKKGLRLLKQAINEFANFIQDNFKWCKMILAFSNKESQVRLIKKCGFKRLCDTKKSMVSVRLL